MNVYDFDKTIYAGDSSIDFYLFCLHKQPSICRCLIRQLWAWILFSFDKLDKKAVKERFFCFLPQLRNRETLLIQFWEAHANKIKPWYLQQKTETDVIISASPDFLIAPICAKMGIQAPIATQMNPANGVIIGQNCKGKEKVRRFYERYPAREILLFYSDSLTDTPLAKIAQKSMLVKKNKIIPWPSNK